VANPSERSPADAGQRIGRRFQQIGAAVNSTGHTIRPEPRNLAGGPPESELRLQTHVSCYQHGLLLLQTGNAALRRRNTSFTRPLSVTQFG
jgi:hypothetical protein